jgi:hypothetical protein
MITFPGVEHEPGQPLSTEQAPIQKFRWSDYRVYPDTTYTYEVHPVYGTPADPRIEAGPTVEVRTESVRRGDHLVLFNRAAAASQAFSRKFPDVDAELAKAKEEGRPQELPSEALAWLSRGLLEQINGFIARAADATWALDIAIYEYELPAIIDAVKAALDRGAEVRIVYHAASGDKQTEENEKSLEGWPTDRLRPRMTSNIFHDKFAVLSRVRAGERDPVSVLCGSTNWTRSGVYLQANVVHVAERPELAGRYLRLFELLFGGATVAETRQWIDANDPLPTDQSPLAGFSPGRARRTSTPSSPRSIKRSATCSSAPRSTSTIGSSRRSSAPHTTTCCGSASRTAPAGSPATTGIAPPSSSPPPTSRRGSRAFWRRRPASPAAS